MPEKEVIRILYVDDDQEDQKLVSSILKTAKRNKYVVETAQTIDDALNKLKDSYTLFLVGYNPGREEQLNLIKEIKAIRKYAPLIMLTGVDSDTLDKEILNLGAADYLIRGQFDTNTFERRLQYAIRDSKLLESLEKTSKKFRSIFEKAADPFILMDAKSKILEANPIFISKFGLDPHDPDPRKVPFLSDLFLDKYPKDLLLENLKNETESFEIETVITTEEGIIINTQVSVVKQEADQYQVLIKDLSSLKAREEEELNLKKFSSTGRIARLLAHEVKNPLTTIVLSADQLQTELPKESLTESGDLIEVIRRNCDRINHLVSQLLNSTRFSELDIQNHSIEKLLDEALDQVNDRIELKGIKVSKFYQKEKRKLPLDGEKIKIAFINLFVNAIESMNSEDGKLTIKTQFRGNHCQIEICDNGEGIAKENLERIFEPFFTQKTGGSGLGLTNTQNIIFSHGGTIRARSEVAKGTCFLIRLNLVQEIEKS
ncbi:hybrid sensor histidine kinase/response regulator [Algoriphagus boritolerans]|uniref:histidine kinase n=1 Tax=Algoriphagus boritolerans DSM 17298 = JCM 18970 TaxID=1120964 RepID=A0A1H6A9Z8_9BACT|nr:hybrid sensor histidine kinase/response regulator [Algoriphagus boritolerans]SEG44566.1 PAS domain S-box-containing protein [Algoriphagus boritolerans DSM 17298 = JCM 18970]